MFLNIDYRRTILQRSGGVIVIVSIIVIMNFIPLSGLSLYCYFIIIIVLYFQHTMLMFSACRSYNSTKPANTGCGRGQGISEANSDIV